MDQEQKEPRDPKLFFERLRELREYRRLTQDDVAEWFDLSGASYGRKERGLEGGFGLGEIAKFLDKTDFTSAYLFFETDSIEASDKRKIQNAETLDVAKELRELKLVVEKKIPASSRRDPLVDSLGNQTIREIVSCVQTLSPSLKQNALGYCKGLHAATVSAEIVNELDEKKRNGTEG